MTVALFVLLSVGAVRTTWAGLLQDTFNPNADNVVQTVALEANGNVLIGGAFTTVGGAQFAPLARTGPQGNVDTTFKAHRRSTIVSGNKTGAMADAISTDRTFTGANNLVGHIAAGSSSLPSDTLIGINSLLAPLADNGGPTPTHALPVGSPAIGTGNNAAGTV